MGRIEPDRDAETANGNGDQRLPVSGVLLREATAAEIAAAAAWYAARSEELAVRAQRLRDYLATDKRRARRVTQ